MKQTPFLLCLCLRGAFTGFWRFFFSLFLWTGSGKPCMTARFINETSRHPRQANRGRMILFVRPDRPGQTDNIILPCCQFARFHASGILLFSFCRFFFYGFPFWGFLPNLPLLPFTSVFAPFSRPHQAVIFVLGAKVTPGFDGKARSSLLFCAEISTPAQASGSISAKNLAFPNPYLFKHPKRKRPMRQKDALKKCRINERQIR